jgi:thiol-disulfide isomerase/thioredoxin
MFANIEYFPPAHPSMGQSTLSRGFFPALRGGFGAAAATLLWSLPAPAEPALPSRAVLLFVAGWCAPCQAELQQLPQITEAARPFRVLVVPVDRGRRVERMLESVPTAQRWRPEGATWTRVQADLLSQTAGLPYSVVLGADGEPCGSSRRGLDSRRVAELVAHCTASR